MEYYGNKTGPNALAADQEYDDPTNCSTFMVICVEENNDNSTINGTACEVRKYYITYLF